MAEEDPNDSFPDLKELENKVGMKTPESLLMWMRDAADCEDGWRSDDVDRADGRSFAFSDCFSDKISNLKQEMRRLRSADVRILRQLVAVHEGIEAMRWLLEERDASVSRDSSLTGSLSSLGTVEDQGPFMYTCRESLSLPHDLTEATDEESAAQPPHTDHGDLNPKSFSDMLSPESTEASPHSPSPSTSKPKLSRSTHGRHGRASSSPATSLLSANLPKPQPRDSNGTPVREAKAGADAIRRALLRSSRREVKADAGSFALTQQSEETQAVNQTQDGFMMSQDNKMEEEESAPPSRETMLLGYDAQWCWVESQDDVTFL